MEPKRVPQGKYDVANPNTGQAWAYTDTVKDHFFHPRNILLEEPKEGEFDAVGEVGSPACGDMMRMWLKIDPKSERITQLKWKTFGCGSAIAATSMYSEMLTEHGGMTLTEALAITPKQIMERLGGLPDRKIHCSVLADKAFLKTANAYFRSTGQHERIRTQGARVIDEDLHITDHDIEEAVLEGARTIEDVQKRLKVGIGNPAAIAAIEELIRFYAEKYYG